MRDLPLGVLAAPDEAADEQAVLVRRRDDVGRRRPERVHEHADTGCASDTST